MMMMMMQLMDYKMTQAVATRLAQKIIQTPIFMAFSNEVRVIKNARLNINSSD